MALNIIDALVVTLGLDNSDFRKGKKETESDLAGMRDQGKKTTDSLDDGGKRAAESFRSLRNETAGFLVVLAGANSIKSFAANMVESDAATGRLATSLGVSTKELSAWQIAAQKAGGTASDANAAFQQITSIFENVRLRGDLSQGAELAGLGVSDLTNPTNALNQLAAARDRMGAPEFQNRLQHLGISQGMINLLMKGSAEVARLTEESRQNGAVTDEQSRAAQRFEATMVELQATLKNMVRPELTGLLQGVTSVVSAMKDANAIAPALEVTLGAVGLAATAAAAPWLTLAAVIGSVVVAYRDFQRLRHMSADERKKFDQEGERLRAEGGGELARGDIGGFLGTLWRGFSDRAGIGGNAPATTVTPNGGAGDSLFERLIRQESGGRAGISGPMTRYGQAHGMTQMLDSTARAVAHRLGVTWRPDLMRGTSAEAIAYQRQLGRAYLNEGLARYGGNEEMALKFYHGGPNQRLWGAKTNAYAASILGGTRSMAARSSIPGAANSVTIGTITVNTAATDGPGTAKALTDRLAQRGLVYQAQSGMTS